MICFSSSFAFFFASGGRSSSCKGGRGCGCCAAVVHSTGFIVDGDEEIGGREAGGRQEGRAKGDNVGGASSWFGCYWGGEAVLEREMLRGDGCVLEKERSVAEGLKVEGGGGAAVFGLFKYGWRRDSVGL